MKENLFEIEFTVRDYELDSQGIVNNSVYQNYLEHARHQFLKSIGLNFNELHRQGTDAVVYKVELLYKKALRGDDRFIVTTRAEPSGNVRFIFYQEIRLLPNRELVLTGEITAVFMNDGRAIRPPKEMTEAVKKR